MDKFKLEGGYEMDEFTEMFFFYFMDEMMEINKSNPNSHDDILKVLKEINNSNHYWINFLCEKFDIKTFNFDIKSPNMIPVDVGKLYFETGYEEELENIFSNTLNKKIILNRKILNEYKKNNIKLLAKTFNIENANELSPKELLEVILEPYPESIEILKCLKQ
jgi:hypothetical protein